MSAFVLDIQWKLRPAVKLWNQTSDEQPLATGSSMLTATLDALLSQLKDLNVQKTKIDEVRLLASSDTAYMPESVNVGRSPLCKILCAPAGVNASSELSNDLPKLWHAPRHQSSVVDTRTQVLADLTNNPISAAQNRSMDGQREIAVKSVGRKVNTGRNEENITGRKVDTGRNENLTDEIDEPPQKPCLWLGSPLQRELDCIRQSSFSFAIEVVQSPSMDHISPISLKKCGSKSPCTPSIACSNKYERPTPASEFTRTDLCDPPWSALSLPDTDLSSWLSLPIQRRPTCVPPFDPQTFPEPHGARPPMTKPVCETSRVDIGIVTAASSSRARATPEFPKCDSIESACRSKSDCHLDPSLAEPILTPSVPSTKAIDLLRSKFRIPESPHRRRRHSNEAEVGAKIRELRFAYGIF